MYCAVVKEVYDAISYKGHINDIDEIALKNVMVDLVSEYPTMYRNDLSTLDTGRDKSNEVVRWLEALGINKADSNKYAALMAERGVDTVPNMAEIGPNTLDGFGMRPVHKTR